MYVHMFNMKSGTSHGQSSLFFILFIEVGSHSEPRARLLPSLASLLQNSCLCLLNQVELKLHAGPNTVLFS